MSVVFYNHYHNSFKKQLPKIFRDKVKVMMGIDLSYPLPKVAVNKIYSHGWRNHITVTEPHEYYDIKSIKHSSGHNFAIVTLWKAADFNSNIDTMCLPEDPSRDSYTEQGFVLGFGYTKDFRDNAEAIGLHLQKQRTLVKQSFDTIDVTKSCRKKLGSFALPSKEGSFVWMEM